MPRSVPVVVGNVVPLNYMSPTPLGATSWTKISAGTSYSVGIKSDNTLYAWGTNTVGQIGLGDTITRSSPVLLSATGISNFSSISAGLDHVTAITTDGRLYSWGNSTGVNSLTIIQSWTQISYGGTHTLAIRNDGILFTWGLNNAGQLGDGTTVNKSSPVQVGTTSWTDVSAGVSHSIALTSNNLLLTWGLNNAGQLGLGTTVNKIAPTLVGAAAPVDIIGNTLTAGGDPKMTYISPFASGSYDIATYGGSCFFNGTTNYFSIPSNAGFSFSTGAYTIEGWVNLPVGTNNKQILSTSTNFLLGTGGFSGSTIGALRFFDNVTTFVGSASYLIATGTWNHFAVVRENTSTDGFKMYVNGVLVFVGTSTRNHTSSAIIYIGATDTVTDLITGYMSNLRVVKGVAVYTTASTTIGTQVFTPANAPLASTQSANVNGSPSAAIASGTALLTFQSLGTPNTWADVTAGISYSSAIDSTGKLFAWGLNNIGQLGDATTTTRSSPVQISAGTSWTSVSTGGSFTVGITSTGALYNWGLNSVNQLGDQTTINRSAPVQLDTNSWSQISAGTSHTLAIRTNNTLWAWGQNTAINLVVEPQSWTSISSSQSHTLAIKSDGSLWSWGVNVSGQLGTADTLNRSMPVLVNGLSSFSVVYAGPNTSYAIRSDGRLFTWGLNTSYQMGDGSAISKSSPVQVLATMSWTKVTAGTSHALAIASSNYLWGWGLQTQGQIGTNGTTTKPNPVQIGTSDPTDATGISVLTKIGNPVMSHFSPFASGAYDPATYGGSCFFGGVANDSFSAPNSTSLDLTSGDFTIECWAYAYTFATNGPYIFNKGGVSGTNAGAYGITYTTGAVSFLVSNSTTATTGQLFSFGSTGTNILTNTWYHYAVTRSGTTISTYLNGTRVTSTTQTVAIVDTTRVLTIGNQINGSGLGGGNWPGYVSNLRIVKGVVVYTGTSFTPSTVPLTVTQSANINGNPSAAITAGQTSLLTLQGIGTPSSWSQVSANSSHSIAIRSDGNLFGWGFNASYQVGDNTTITKSSPVQITSGINTSFNVISAGFDHNLALSTTNKLYGWGSSTALGYINEPYSWTMIASGTGHTAAIRSDGLLFTWGLNSVGQLGLTDTINRSSPVLVGNPNQGTVLSNSWTNVHAGSSTTVAIRSDGTLWAWGLGTTGELGYGTAANRSSPVQIGSDTNWTNVTVGLSHTIATKTDKTAYAWGLNTNGQLGINNAISRSSPVQVTNALVTSWNQISAGTDHTLGVASTGLLYGWGKNDLNQTGTHPAAWTQIITVDGEPFSQQNASIGIRGDGTLWYWGSTFANQSPLGNQIEYSSPVQVGTSSWIAVGMNISGGVAVRADRTLWGWGAIGISGIGDGIPRSSPIQIGTDTDWSDRIFVGPASVHALKTDGKLYGWNTSASIYYLGDGITYARSTPTLIDGASWTQVTFTHGIRSNGTLWAWGSTNATTINGLADGVASRSSMVQVGTSSWLFVSAGNTQQLGQAGPTMYAIDINYRLFAWGINAAGQIGDNTAVGKNVITLIGTSSWIAVGGTGSSARGIDILGRLYGWGISTQGNNGTNTTINRSTPTQIATGTSFAFVSSRGQAGPGAITTLGDLYMWGSNTRGGLGLGNTVNRSAPTLLGTAGPALATGVSAPTQISYLNLTKGITSWTEVSAGQSQSMAITFDNRLFVWGLNNAGQLGFGASGTTLNRTIFSEQIGGSWVDVSSGISYTVAERSDGGLFAWGLNSSGQLGNTTTINRSSPVQIGTSSFTYVNAGGTHAGAVKLDGSIFGFGLGTTGQLGLYDALSRSSPVVVGSTGLKTLTFYPVKIDGGENSWSSVSAGQSYSLALRATTGALYAWGLGTSGQLGDSTLITKSSPVQIGTSSWSSVSAGSSFAVAIKTDNLLYAWGLGTTGQVGDNTVVTKSSPVLIGAFGQGINNSTMSPIQLGIFQGITTSWTKISAGNSTSIAIRSTGELYVWGLGTSGQMGTSLGQNRSSITQLAAAAPVDASGNSYPITVMGAPTRVLTVSPFASGSYDSATYGGSYFLNSFTDYFLLPTTNVCDFLSGTAFTVECWVNTTVARAANNIFFSTQGTNTAGCLYFNMNAAGNVVVSTWDGASRPNTLVSTITLALNTWYHIVIQRTTTNVYSMYIDGIKRATDATNTLSILSGLPSVGANPISNQNERLNGYVSNLRIVKGVNVYSGTSTTVANFTVPTVPLTATQSANTNIAALVTNDTTLLSFTGLNDPIPSWSQVSTNLSGMSAIRSDGLLYVWGDNANGTLGTNNLVTRSSPVIVQGFNSETRSFTTQIPGSWSAASAGQSHTIAINSANKLFAWGLNTSGQLGTNDVLLRSSPTQVGLSSWTNVFADGGQTSYAIKTDGLYAWGLGTTGQTTGYMLAISRSNPNQIGNNALASVNQSSPAQIGAGSWSKIGAGASFSAAIKTDGTLYAWGGLASSGQVGDGTTVAKSSPTQISGSWSEIGVGFDHAAAIRSDNILLVWGNNGLGQLGTFDAISRSSPTLLAGSFATTSWNKVASGLSFTIATDTNSLLYTWGINTSGQLGLNNIISRSSPTQVSSTLSFISLTAGSTHAGGIINGGLAYNWGLGTTGQLAETYNNISRSTPVTVGGAYPIANVLSPAQIGTDSWRLVSAGNSYSVAIRSDYKLFAWGVNTGGVYGINDTISRSSPIQVNSKDWNVVSAGLSHVMGITR